MTSTTTARSADHAPPRLPVLRSEWLKIRTLRSLRWTLFAVLAVSTAFSGLSGTSDTSEPGFDPLFTALVGVVPGQVAAIAFGALAVSAEFHGGGLRVSLTAVPRRGRWFAAKATAIAVPVLGVGLLTGAAALAAARSGLGAAANGLTWSEQARGVAGFGVYVTLMALLAAGLTALLRSGVAALSVLIPFVLITSFVIGDQASAITDFLPDKAGQVVLQQTSESSLGPWTGLVVTAAWTAAALLAGAWSVRRRDA